MTIAHFLINDLKPIGFDTKPTEALNLMEEFRFSHFPVLNENQTWAGNISYNQLISEFNISKRITPDLLEDFYATEEDFFLACISKFGNFRANFIPVINHQNKYLGYVTLEDLMAEMAKHPFYAEPFTWLSVKNNTVKFAMSEISKILESNNAKTFGIAIQYQNEIHTSAYIKLQVEHIDSLIQTFERFGYVVEIYKKEGEHYDLLNDRFGNLLKYMEL